MYVRRVVASLVVPCLLICTPARGVGQSSSDLPSSARKPVTWPRTWHRFDTLDASLTALGAGTQITLEYAVDPPARWRGPIGFDAPVQRSLVASSPERRHRWALASDITLGLSMAHAAAIDPFAAWQIHGDGDLGLQMTGMALESMAITGGITGIVKALAGRSRPPPPRCRGRATAPDCPDREHRSFFSGHTSLAFAGFSTFAVVHARLPIYGSPWDAVATGGYGVVAWTTGVLRIVANKHYASDILVGALVGSAIGAATPLLLHMRDRDGPSETNSTRDHRMSLRPGLGGPRVVSWSMRW